MRPYLTREMQMFNDDLSLVQYNPLLPCGTKRPITVPENAFFLFSKAIVIQEMPKVLKCNNVYCTSKYFSF